MSQLLRNLGTTATFQPQLKRAVARHTDNRTFTFVPDTNRSGSNGDNVTGVASFNLYASSDSGRTSWSLAFSHTPVQAAMSSTQRFVGSMAMNSNNDIFIAYQGTDNSLRLVSFAWDAVGLVYGAGVSQTVVAANAVTSRYRSIDIDVANSTTGNPAIIAYESLASSGVGAYARVYVRLDDGTTWRKAYEVQLQTAGTILSNSEDVSISYGADGIVSNVGRLAIYFTQTSTASDSGDTIREISFNVSTGTDLSASTVITWASAFSQNTAAGSRRAWLFKNKLVGGTACWVIGGLVGLSSPFFYGQKLHHNTASPIFYNKTSSTPTQITSGKFKVYTASDRASYCAVSATFSDQRLRMVFVGLAPASYSNAMRLALFRWNDTVEGDVCASVDTVSRVLDNNYSILSGSLGIFGGANQLSAGKFEYTELAIYGAGGDSVSATAGTLARYACVIIEDTLATPTIIQPGELSTVGTGTPRFQVFSPSQLNWHSVRGRLQLQFATVSDFSAGAFSVNEALEYRVYESTNGGTSGVQYSIDYTLPLANRLATGTWYVRARIADDLGGFSGYFGSMVDWDRVQFSVSHPPAALPVAPSATSTIAYGAGNATFSWKFSDPDPSDTQTAYQIVLSRLDTGIVVTDTGKVSSAAKSAVIAVASSLRDVPLGWKIRLWDGDNTSGIYSNQVTFTMSNSPVVVVTSPTAGSVINTPAPTIGWTFSADGTRTQTHSKVVITDTTASPSVVVADTGWISGAAASYTFLTPILHPSNNYKVSVSVRDSVGLTATSADVNFSTVITPTFAGNTSVVTDSFKSTVSWTNVNQDSGFIAWRVYRRYNKASSAALDVDNTRNTWVLIYETTSVQSSYTYLDYTAPLNKPVDYIVTQVADRSGSITESAIPAPVTVTIAGDRYYFVPEVPIGAIASFEANYVTADGFQPEVEQEVLHVINRGRQIQVGDDLGYTGQLQLKLRNPSTARSDREFIELLAKVANGATYIRSPFGDVMYVRFTAPSFTRLAGVGTGDLGDLSVSYTEVYTDVPLTRTV